MIFDIIQSAAKTLVSVGVLAILANVAPGVATAQSGGSLETTWVHRVRYDLLGEPRRHRRGFDGHRGTQR